MLQADKPEDFVISTGVVHSVREFIIAAFKHISVEIEYVSIIHHHYIHVYYNRCLLNMS